MILSVDPGLTGAVALLKNKETVVDIWDMPVMAALHGKGNVVNPYELHRIFKGVANLGVKTVYIEQVAAMPGQGVSSMFKFGAGFGTLQGVAAANGFSMEFVTPQKWKKFCGLIGRDKDAARTLAIQKFPATAEQLARKKDIGRADALLIGVFALSQEFDTY